MNNFHKNSSRTRDRVAARFALGTVLLFALCFSLAAFGVQVKKEAELQRVLSQMESVGKTFRTFTARFSKKKFTEVLKEFDTPETGEFCYARAKDGSALLRMDATSPGRSILTIKGGTATSYQPGIRQAQIVNLGQNKDKAEYLAIGIGQSPAKLQETFHLSYQGVEQVNGAACSILVLHPKNPKAAAFFSSITLWIRKSSGIPVQQKLQEPSGDYLLVNFSEEKLNSKIPASKFEQKLPAGTDIQRLQ